MLAIVLLSYFNFFACTLHSLLFSTDITDVLISPSLTIFREKVIFSPSIEKPDAQNWKKKWINKRTPKEKQSLCSHVDTLLPRTLYIRIMCANCIQVISTISFSISLNVIFYLWNRSIVGEMWTRIYLYLHCFSRSVASWLFSEKRRVRSSRCISTSVLRPKDTSNDRSEPSYDIGWVLKQLTNRRSDRGSISHESSRLEIHEKKEINNLEIE